MDGKGRERENLRSCFGSDYTKLLGAVILTSEAASLFHFFSQEDQLCFVLCQAFFFHSIHTIISKIFRAIISNYCVGTYQQYLFFSGLDTALWQLCQTTAAAQDQFFLITNSTMSHIRKNFCLLQCSACHQNLGFYLLTTLLDARIK